MIRPSIVLRPIGMGLLEEVRATIAAGLVILLIARVCRAVEDHIEDLAASREVEKPEDPTPDELVGQCAYCDDLGHETSEHPWQPTDDEAQRV